MLRQTKTSVAINIDLFAKDDTDCIGNLFDATTMDCQFCAASDACATIFDMLVLTQKKAALSKEKSFLDELEPLHLLDFMAIEQELNMKTSSIRTALLVAKILELRPIATERLIRLYLDVELKARGYIIIGEFVKYNAL